MSSPWQREIARVPSEWILWYHCLEAVEYPQCVGAIFFVDQRLANAVVLNQAE